MYKLCERLVFRKVCDRFVGLILKVGFTEENYFFEVFYLELRYVFRVSVVEFKGNCFK